MNEPEPQDMARGGRFAFLADESPIPTVAGIVVVLVGFALIAVTWGLVAGKTNVALQVPYLVSGGLTGVGLIMAGLLMVNLAAKRRDAAEQGRQLDQLASTMRDLAMGLQRLDER